jgi:putative peptide zinc metalloprotease protein
MARVEEMEMKLGPIQIGLRSDLVVTRHVLRDRPGYVIHDPVTFANHSFTAFEYRVLTILVPQRTLRETFASAVERGILEQGEKEGFYRFILRLHGMNLLHLPITDAPLLYSRYQEKQKLKRGTLLRNVVYYRIPLFDPDKFLDKTIGYVRWAYTRTGLILWLSLMVVVVYKCWGRFGEMFASAANLLELSNVPILFVTLVALKAIHEFGHAYACKRFGGAVPEMGLVFILLTPCAFVDASASWKFPNRWHRIAVGLAGMYVESTIAMIFALIWISTQAGFLHDVAQNVVVLASIVTVLFNINPLMRFDGYYIFTDVWGTPNLWARAGLFVKSRAKSIVLGLKQPEVDLSPTERILYPAYGASAVVYKFFLGLGITTMVMLKWPIAGMILGVTIGYSMLVRPLLRCARYMLTDEETEPVRERARVVAWSTMALAALVFFLCPVSFSVVVPGVLEPERYQVVRAPAGGFIVNVAPKTGDHVQAGEPLVVLQNPALRLQLQVAQKELKAETARLESTEIGDPVQAEVHRARVELLMEQCQALSDRLSRMKAVANEAGRVVSPPQKVGRFVAEGDELMEIHSGRSLVRVVLSEQEVGRAKPVVGSIFYLRWNVTPNQTVRAVVREVLPAASRQLVPKPLTVLGGGEVYGTRTMTTTHTLGADPGDGNASRAGGNLLADRPYLHVILEPESVPLGMTAGLRARVSLTAPVETVGGWLRRRMMAFYNAWRMS